MIFELLSLADLFALKEIIVYSYDDDLVLTTSELDVERLIHLYENEVDGRTMFGINKGQIVHLDKSPSFSGRLSSIEISWSRGDTDWDFQSLVLRGGDDTLLRVCRNDASFPEPTFVTAP